jgi:hypothetical protein
VAEVDSGLQQLAHGDDGHVLPFGWGLLLPAGPGWNRRPSNAGTPTLLGRRVGFEAAVW